ncbi:hypothetical protein BDK88_4035 [Natrinema hispanicum]|uniref:Uncharacterized protein n=1 Tax=Natrinema hispanicum TaxID=392421 RepID=A0A482Y1K3_9EURY|nr:hypothetical protein BDK88_4035 [Natrinema hispanicum]
MTVISVLMPDRLITELEHSSGNTYTAAEANGIEHVRRRQTVVSQSDTSVS